MGLINFSCILSSREKKKTRSRNMTIICVRNPVFFTMVLVFPNYFNILMKVINVRARWFAAKLGRL